ncbi:unnamed protein product [Penicillium salamii]|nr:unnamed protein product [Penicillium salamii]CAG8204381.1 unnamed protein product [Penicillium salamii]CAG8392446.1 unnamed protein product [Penicillium salamii]
MSNKFSGVLAALITPFTDDGKSVDAGRFKAHIDNLFDAGIHGLVPGGSTGEFTVLSLEERKLVNELAVKYAVGRGPVIAGVGSTKTEEAVDLALHAAKIGVDAIMVVPPYYDPVNYEQLKELLSEIHQASGLPIVYYNIPSVGVSSYKDTSGNAPDFTELVFGHGDKIAAMNGWDTLTFYGMAAGNEAIIWGAANVIPEIAVELWNAIAVQNDIRQGREIWKKIWPICKFLEAHNYSAAIKTGMELRGQKTGGVRKPFALLDPKHHAEYRQLLLNAQIQLP